MSHTNRQTYVSRAKSKVVLVIRPIDVTEVPDCTKLGHNLVAHQGVNLTYVGDVLHFAARVLDVMSAKVY